MNLYTVDRAGSLTQGQICNLQIYNDITPEFLATHVQIMFPEGVSSHGERYFLRNDAKALIASPLIELVFEYVKRSNFSLLPSRFQSMFALDSLDAAFKFREKYANDRTPIWRLRSDVMVRADMNLLHAGNSILVASFFANKYWAGEAGSDDPFWEYVLKCPVEVLDCVA